MSSEADDYTFHCPQCGEGLSVNAAMRTALIEKGCVICGAAVTAAAFSPEQPVDS